MEEQRVVVPLNNVGEAVRFSWRLSSERRGLRTYGTRTRQQQDGQCSEGRARPAGVSMQQHCDTRAALTLQSRVQATLYRYPRPE